MKARRGDAARCLTGEFKQDDRSGFYARKLRDERSHSARRLRCARTNSAAL